MNTLRLACVGLLVFCAASCKSKRHAEEPAKAPSPLSLPQLESQADPSLLKNLQIARGKAVYMSACIACHHPNPKESGSLGPDVYGSSLELLEARVVHGKYPPGYTPKRSTNTMTALPQLKAEIPALHAFLNQ